MGEDKAKTPWGEYIDKTAEDFKELMKRWESIESKEVPLHEAHKKFKPGDTLRIRHSSLSDMGLGAPVKSDADYFKELDKRIEALEKIVSVLLVDDELKAKLKEAAK